METTTNAHNVVYTSTASTTYPNVSLMVSPESGESPLRFMRVNVGLVQEVEEDGRQYLVTPVVAIREGVLNGELVPAKEIGISTAEWDHVPITIGHPKLNGEAVSLLQHPEISPEIVIGDFRNPTFDGKGLHGDIWIDVELAQQQGQEGEYVLEQLRDEIPMDVSTGYIAAVAQHGGSFGEEIYRGIQHGIVPDHLALLPFEKGACSWEDGCGTPRLNAQIENRRSKARTPSYSGTETISWASVSKSFTAYRDGYYKSKGMSKPSDAPSQVKDAPAAMKSWIASKTLLGEASASTTAELISFPVVNPKTNKLNAGALRNAAARASNLSEETKNSVQRIVTRLLNKHFKPKSQRKEESIIGNKALDALKMLGNALGFHVQIEDQSEIFQSVSDCCRCGKDHTDLTFQRFSRSEEGCPFDIWALCPETEEPILSVHQLKVNGANLGTLLTQMIVDQVTEDRPKRTIIKEMADLAGTSTDKVKSIISGDVEFVAHRWLQGFAQALDVSPFDLMIAQERDIQGFLKDKLPSETVTEEPFAIHAEIPKENAEEESGDNTESAEVTMNEEEVQTMPEIRELAEAVLANESLSFTEEDREWLESLPEERLQAMVARTPEQPEEEVVEEPAAPEAEEAPVVTQPRTIADLLATVDNKDLKAELEEMARTNSEIRSGLISQITENSDFTEDELTEKTVSELRKLAALAAKKPEVPTPSYVGVGVPRQQQTQAHGVPEPPKLLTRTRQEENVN